MAFTYCTECGNKMDDSENVCPCCGHVRGTASGTQSQNNFDPNPNGQNSNGQDQNGQNQNSQNPYGQDQNGQNQNPYGQNPYGQNPYGQNPYGQNPYGQNPYGQNQYGQNPYGQNPYGQNPYGQNPYGQNPYGQNPYGRGYNPYGRSPLPMREMNIGMFIFSLINIVLGLCSCVGLIFGIPSLILTMNARNAASDEEADNMIKIALILNIVGVVLTVIVCITGFLMLPELEIDEEVAAAIVRLFLH